jgi:hypothetical protein
MVESPSEKLLVAQLDKKLPTLYRTQRFITRRVLKTIVSNMSVQDQYQTTNFSGSPGETVFISCGLDYSALK